MPPGQRKPWIPSVWLWPVFGLVQVGLGVYYVASGNTVLVISSIALFGLAVLNQVHVLRVRQARGTSEGR